MIEVRGLKKSYAEVQALRGVDLSIREGEIFGLLGPNGAGKSTLMHILSGLLTADGGSVELGGKPVSDAGSRSRILGLVPQEIALYQELTAWANLEIFGRIYGLSRREWQERAEELLTLVNLADRRHEKVKGFSGGMKRRLNLAASLLHQPRCLLCDEPTTGVDPQSRNAIFEFLEARNREGLTIVYTTHYLEEVERLCQRLGIIDDGQVMACGTRDDLLSETGLTGEIRFYDCPELSGLQNALAGLGRFEPARDGVKFHPAAGGSLSRIVEIMETCGYPQAFFEVRRPTLEQCFLQITGKDLRE